MTSLVSVHATVRTTYAAPQDNQFETCAATRVILAGIQCEWRELFCRPRLFGGKLYGQLSFREAQKQFGDKKIRSQFMISYFNMSTNEEIGQIGEREIEREQESRRQKGDVRRERERLRALANRQNMSDEQREKQQDR